MRIETRQCQVCEHQAHSAARQHAHGAKTESGEACSVVAGAPPASDPLPSAVIHQMRAGARAVRVRERIHAPPNEGQGAARAHTEVRSSKLVAPLHCTEHCVDAGFGLLSLKSRGRGVFPHLKIADPASRNMDSMVSRMRAHWQAMPRRGGADGGGAYGEQKARAMPHLAAHAPGGTSQSRPRRGTVTAFPSLDSLLPPQSDLCGHVGER